MANVNNVAQPVKKRLQRGGDDDEEFEAVNPSTEVPTTTYADANC